VWAGVKKAERVSSSATDLPPDHARPKVGSTVGGVKQRKSDGAVLFTIL